MGQMLSISVKPPIDRTISVAHIAVGVVMKFTIKCRPEHLSQMAQTVRLFLSTGPHNRPNHRDCILYVQDGTEPPYKYEVHVWGDDKHVRAYRFDHDDADLDQR